MASTSATTSTVAAAASNTTDATATQDARGRDVVGCLMSAEYRNFAKGDVTEILKYCQIKCSSPELLTLMANMGLHDPSIHLNPHIQKPNNNVYQKFTKAIKALDQECCFGVVFHGTATRNIANILEHGLDPKRRTGQAHGPGVRTKSTFEYASDLFF